MVAKSKRLQVVVELAERQLEEAARQLNKVIEQRQFEQTRLEELQSYFAEYQAQAKQQWGTGISVSRLMNFNYFLNNLRQAIDQQRQTIAHLDGVCDRARQQWVALKGRSKNLQELQQRAFREEDQRREKHLQREIDDNYMNLKR